MGSSENGPPEDAEQVVPDFFVSRSQWAWALFGSAVLILIVVIATANLRDMYNSQKDFVAGSLFSLVGFSFGKALSRTQEQQAMNMIQQRSTPQLRELLALETRRQLYSNNVFSALARVEALIESSTERIYQFLDEPQITESLDYSLDRFADVLAMFDDSALHVSQLRDRLEISTQKFTQEEIWVTLAAITSRVGRANLRRVEMKQRLRLSVPSLPPGALAILNVIGSDVLSARRILTALSAAQTTESLPQHLAVVSDFLTASLERAAELRPTIENEDGKSPLLFQVMEKDLINSLSGIESMRGKVSSNLP